MSERGIFTVFKENEVKFCLVINRIVNVSDHEMKHSLYFTPDKMFFLIVCQSLKMIHSQSSFALLHSSHFGILCNSIQFCHVVYKELKAESHKTL